ncbi:hypothetical protein [Polaromonas glacialis]|uniref:hypothetical protein n=1 Tax=Polaromonas glacialis TaxID=866564 RepID=UPI000A5CDDFA
METAWVDARCTLQAVADSLDSACLTFTPDQTATLKQFAALYRQHLDDENGIAYPAAEASLSPAGLEAMSEDMMQRRGVSPKT